MSSPNENNDYFQDENLEEFTTSIDATSIFNNIESTFSIFEFVSSDINEINFLDIINSYGTSHTTFDSSFINDINNYISSHNVEEILNLSLNTTNSIERGENSLEFESVLYNSIEQTEDKECAVCLSEFKDTDMVSVTKCSHIFHYDCIKEWSHYKNDCPMCRDIL